MIGDNIKCCRKEKKLSQEELAVRLHVVRQTVSKWENNLSVPDADVLVHIAGILEVSVSRLLGAEQKETKEEPAHYSRTELAEELARLNRQLAENRRREKRLLLAGKKRGLILFLSFAALFIALAVKNEVVSMALTGLCLFLAVVILYRNLALLTERAAEPSKIRALKITTIFNLLVLLICIGTVLVFELSELSLSADTEKILSAALLSMIILFTGFIGPRLPFSRHTGLRLPWTVQDEETWNLAHRLLGILSIPTVILFWTLAFTVSDFKVAALVAMLSWIGIPGGLSGIFSGRRGGEEFE